MTIYRLSAGIVALEDLDLFCIELIRKIPSTADPSGSAAAEARLFSSPTHGAEPEMDEEWREYVEPDLRQLFRSAVDVVKTDLQRLPTSDTAAPGVLHLPVENLEAWIHTLNQARLTLAAREGFSEAELDRAVALDGEHRERALFRIHFYGLLQELFLRQLE